MKKFYTLFAAVLAFLCISPRVFAAGEETSSMPKVLWNSVVVDKEAEHTNFTVKFKLKSFDKTDFNGTVIYKIQTDQGSVVTQSEPTTVNLSAANGYTSDDLVLTSTGNPSVADTDRPWSCHIYVNEGARSNVELGAVPINKSGTTGIVDVVAGDDTVTEVYNLSGVRVASGEDVDLYTLTPGLYIVKQGSTYNKFMRR